MNELLKPLINLFYPRRAVCMGCGDVFGLDRDDLCEDCRMRLAESWIGPRIPNRRFQLNGTAYAYNYRGPAGSMARNLKYGSVWILAEEMGADIARAAEQMRIADLSFVTAVPMHPQRLRERGRNHAELLARSAAARLGAEYTEVLRRTRNAPQQARLSAPERRENLKDAFAVPPECRELVKGAVILLVDDVCTTGSTAKSCAEALRRAGASRVYFAAYAVGGGNRRG